MVWFGRGRRARRVALVATVPLLALAWFAWSRRGERYVPGTGAEGLFDSLGRQLPADAPKLAFRDVSGEAGFTFRHFPATRSNLLPEDMGSGVALGDADGDGWTDAFLPNLHGRLGETAANGSGRCALLRNRGEGTFEDVSRAAGVDLALLANAGAFADVDSDGDLDLVVSAFGSLTLLANDGSAHFEDRTSASGLAGFDGFWTGIAVGDYDRDGALDLYVCGYVRYSIDAANAGRSESQYGVDIPVALNPSAYPPERNLLFHGRGDGTFEEVGEALGVSNPTGRSLSASFADISGDGWPDIYVANDVSDNAYFESRGGGTFEDRAAAAQIADYRGAMGLAFGDVDDDSDLDFVVTHWLAQENAFYLNMSRMPGVERAEPLPLSFMDQADRFGLGATTLDKVGWATRLVDFDNDGVLDLFVANGSTVPRRDDRAKLAPQKSQVFWNAGGKRGFFDLGRLAGEFFGAEHVARGGATFDYDLDGDEDLVIISHGEGAHLLRNDGGNARRSVRVRLRAPAGNRFAIGARLEARIGARTVRDELDTQGSYLSQHAVGELAFGLGAAARIDELRVTWPDGASDSFGPIPADTLVTWTRGSAPRVELLPGKREAALAGPSDVAEQRRFYADLDATTRARIAGDLEGAVAGYRRALESWPSHEDCLYNLGNALIGLGRRDEALAAYRTLVMFHSESNRGWMQIGTWFLAHPSPTDEMLREAEVAFERCHDINKEESQPFVRLGLVAMVRGDLSRAQECLEGAARLNPQSIEARYFLGRVAWLRGDVERARARLGEAQELARAKPPPQATGLHEGETRTGAALVASTPVVELLDRWRSVADRSLDPAAEYGVR